VKLFGNQKIIIREISFYFISENIWREIKNVLDLFKKKILLLFVLCAVKSFGIGLSLSTPLKWRGIYWEITIKKISPFFFLIFYFSGVKTLVGNLWEIFDFCSEYTKVLIILSTCWKTINTVGPISIATRQTTKKKDL
jgi:hypothetical protein